MAFQGLHTAISGLNAAQIGLYVTGHNMANNHTMGFTRQIVTQAHFVHRTIGSNAMGPMQVGLGTQMTGIRQVRSHFHDMRWRETAPRLSYWETRAATHMELDSIFGELQGHYRLQLSLTNLNAALNELNNDTSSIETRSNFISQAATFIDRANAAHRSMTEYQMQLNNDVKATVQRVNQILTDIDELNQRIVLERNKGQNPNDFLDWRNNLLDELSTIMDINIIEVVGGSVNILTAHGGNQLLVNGNVSRLGLQYSYPGWPFVEPVFTHEERILAFDEDAPPLFNWDALGRNYILANGGERGHLLSLIVNRGLGPIDHTSAPIETEAEIVARFNTLLDGWITGAGIAAPPDPDGVAAETFRTQFVAMLNAPSFARPDISTITIPAVLNTWAGAQTPPIDVLGEMERFVFDMDLVAKRR
ncbi:MAG: hypothetical protein FWE44_05220, partial [Defluviitaleaceae bacterium]|nr:hypothetical protein [Defluviitaleaceae bacterium]